MGQGESTCTTPTPSQPKNPHGGGGSSPAATAAAFLAFSSSSFFFRIAATAL
jgi:hypothetical protein